MSAEMNSLERVLTAIAGGTPDRVPVVPLLIHHAIKLAGYRLGKCARDPQKLVNAHINPHFPALSPATGSRNGLHRESYFQLALFTPACDETPTPGNRMRSLRSSGLRSGGPIPEAFKIWCYRACNTPRGSG